MKPDIFVMDEPSSNLDRDAIETLKQNLKIMKEKGKTIIIAEHRLYYLMDLADRFFYFSDGMIKGIYTKEQILMFPPKKLKDMGLRSLKKEKLVIKEESQKNSIKIRDLKVVYKDVKTKKKRMVCMDKMEIPLNEITAIVGENGTGKSTLLRTLAGLQKNASVNVEINGEKYNKKKRLKEAFFVMQDVNHQLFTESVEEEIRLGARDLSDEKLQRILKQFDLFHLRYSHPMNLSGGEKQRVLLAAAVSSGKKILLLDEPTSGLDYKQMDHVANALTEAKKQVACMIVVTHDPEFIKRCCTSVRYIHTRQEILKDFLHIKGKIRKIHG